ncbi:MAG TPA: TolC family protein [Verrucomicrobiota bacterium]|nr:TolC family protein [Verrucomicrobiales bacterium]HRI16164.1 TolC family protein [Verrucomicrobiota bacterium]
MSSFRKVCALAVGVPLVFMGCTTTDPQAAFDGVNQTVSERTGTHLRWMRDEAAAAEMEQEVDGLLRTNLTAHSALTIALLNNRSLQAKFEEIGVSQAELAQASRARNPVISASWRPPLNGRGVVNSDYGLTQNLLDLLMLPARKKIAARQLDQIRDRLAQQVLDFNQEVQSAFYTFQARQQFAERLAIIVEVNEAAADIARRQFEAGNLNSLELKNQQLAFTQSRLDLAKVQAEARAEREKVNRLLGLWGRQTAWQVTEELPALPREELSLDDVEAAAVTRRFDLAASRNEVVAAAYAYNLKQNTRYLPGVDIGVSSERDVDGIWVLGPTLDLEIPLFDQGQPELAKLGARYRQARRQFEALAVNIRSEVRAARDALLAARDIATYSNQVLLPQNQQLLGETLLQYNAMQMGNYDLLLAKQREQQAEQAAIEALRDYWIARTRLQTALGGGFTPSLASGATPAPLSSALRPSASRTSHEHQH